MTDKPKPTIEELEAILNGPECLVLIRPDGSLDVVNKDDVVALRAEVERLRAFVDVVRENYDKCRLVPEEVVQTMLARGKGYIGIPHEECIEEIKVALDALGDE